MKKLIYSVSALALVVMFSACGSAASNGEKIAKKECECNKLREAKKEADGEDAKKKAKKEYDMCMFDLSIMEAEMVKKYADDSAASNEAKKAYKEAYNKCKNEE